MESVLKCKHCGSRKYRKNGIDKGNQSYFCKDCHRRFSIPKSKKGYETSKLLAIILYGSGKASYRYLAKLFNVCPATIMNWIKSFSEKIDVTKPNASITEIEIDEMWHFIESKKTNCGLLKPLIEQAERRLRGLRADEILKLLNDYTKK
jgi:transposase